MRGGRAAGGGVVEEPPQGGGKVFSSWCWQQRRRSGCGGALKISIKRGSSAYSPSAYSYVLYSNSQILRGGRAVTHLSPPMRQRPGRRAPPLQKCLRAHGAGQRDVLRRRSCHQPVPPTRQAISSRPHSPSVGTAVTLPTGASAMSMVNACAPLGRIPLAAARVTL